MVLEPGDLRDVRLTVTPGGTLVGTVVDAVTLRPIGNARVVIAEDALAMAPRAIVAEANGTFRVTGLLRRPQQVSARAPGYVPRLGTLATPDGPAVAIPLDRQVALTGRVVDSEGHGVSGAQIEVTARDLDGRQTWLTASATMFRDALFDSQVHGPRPLLPSGELGVMPGPVPLIPISEPGFSVASDALNSGYVTDADGRFHVDEVPPGVVSVVATHPAYVRGASAETLARAGESLSLQIVLRQGGTIDGRVVDDRGFGMAAQTLEVRSAGDPIPRRAFAQHDGGFRVPGVLGHVEVAAVVAGRVVAQTEADVADGAVVPVTLVIDRAGRTVRGRVVDSRGYPVGGAEVTIAPLDHRADSVRVLSATDGTFSTAVAGQGAVQLDARHPDYAPRSMRVDDTANEVSVALAAGGALSLRLTALCATGDIALEVRTPCGPSHRVLHRPSDLEVDHLCDGAAIVIASAPGCVASEASATIASGAVASATLDLGAGGSARGDVVDARGDPVAGAVVHLANVAATATVGTARTGRRGEFMITDLPAGDLSLVATHATLGESGAVPVRVIPGTIAQGLRLTYSSELSGGSGTTASDPVVLVDRDGHVEVLSVAPDSAAARAGVQQGDDVVGVQGSEVHSALEASRALQGPAGDEVSLDLTRDGAQRTVRFVRER